MYQNPNYFFHFFVCVHCAAVRTFLIFLSLVLPYNLAVLGDTMRWLCHIDLIISS